MASGKRWTAGSLLPLAARLALGGVWLYAGYSKLADVPAFAREIANYKLLAYFNPSLGFLESLAAIMLPWNEVAIGAMLIAGIWTRACALISMFFLALFAVAVTTAIARKLNISCGCFGSETASRVGLTTLGIEAVCLALAIIVFATSVPPKSKR